MPSYRKAKLNEDLCLGCGLCVRTCARDHIPLRSRPESMITPLNGTHRVVVMALERGQLQDLLFDSRALWSHRVPAGILGVILRLRPVEQTLPHQ